MLGDYRYGSRTLGEWAELTGYTVELMWRNLREEAVMRCLQAAERILQT